MATDGRSPAIIDTSVLVNFLALDRADLLARHPLHRFVVVDLVRDEVVKRTSSERLLAAFQAGYVLPDGPPEAVAIEEIAAFAAISLYDALGRGECAASAAAHARGLPLFMDDEAAWKKVDLAFPGMAREGTATLVAALVKSGVLDVAQADAMKADWEANHRFRLKFASFLEIL